MRIGKAKKLTIAELDKLFYEIAVPVLTSEKMQETKYFHQHRGTSVYYHSLSVAYFSLVWANKLRIKCDYKSLIRGALLHDYYLYDWREKDKSHSWHGFRHPFIAAKKAHDDFGLNDLETEIIQRHMFPLTPIPPRHLEAFIVSMADKVLAIREMTELNIKKLEQLKNTLNYTYGIQFVY